MTLSTGGASMAASPDEATSVTLAGTSASGFSVNYYLRSANVTAFVQAHGAGAYEVRGVPGTQNETNNALNAAGWTLVVAYRDGTQPVRNLSVLVGGSFVDEDTQQDYVVSGFCAPPSGPIEGKGGAFSLRPTWGYEFVSCQGEPPLSESYGNFATVRFEGEPGGGGGGGGEGVSSGTGGEGLSSGTGGEGLSSGTGGEAGSAGEGGAGAAPPGDSGDAGSDGGCGCATPGQSGRASASIAGAALLALAAATRRRRARRTPR
ncbi:MYXO-CTERM sorting domain-containing protein [Sorangium sp. So ce302]|uniref:MYXO-CTERM sorting domain-containing protein n=1 Tax=Sorangium sp. So ce302 TaxID=3133297 RepID=UPI003F6054AA